MREAEPEGMGAPLAARIHAKFLVSLTRFLRLLKYLNVTLRGGTV